MTGPPDLPGGLELVRTTAAFTARTVPAGLLREHRIAAGVWGRLRVLEGSVRFVLEATGDHRDVRAGEHQVIEPEVPHRVEPSDDVVFLVEFHRPAPGPAT